MRWKIPVLFICLLLFSFESYSQISHSLFSGKVKVRVLNNPVTPGDIQAILIEQKQPLIPREAITVYFQEKSFSALNYKKSAYMVLFPVPLDTEHGKNKISMIFDTKDYLSGVNIPFRIKKKKVTSGL